MFKNYDLIVVGGGHAGCEAACAAATLGSKVLMVTMKLEAIGQMSCNPAMGGIAKGQIIREIDALGGYSGIIADKSMIQFRMLNKSKGPAMWSPRTQNDRSLFASQWRATIESINNIELWQDTVSEVIVKEKIAIGVKTTTGVEIKAKSIILTNGTFLNAIIHIGSKKIGGGRAGEKAALGLTQQLVEIGFESERMKTGTSPRIDGRTIDYTKIEKQQGDTDIKRFSFTNTPLPKSQKCCHVTYTNKKTHEIIRQGFDQSPLFDGSMSSAGPRYCPSIEDKVQRFAERERHQIFVEPEGWNTYEVYLNGISTSLPLEIQNAAIRSIKSLENANMIKPGYAIEYDYFLATQLKSTLETHLIENLYFAGQINGTTGYEEAACQGLIAGINAHRKNTECTPFVLSRKSSYIGVLIDDLTTKPTKEPYRMFTSRAEFRILLRQDNADLRLTEKGYKIGMISENRMQKLSAKKKAIQDAISILEKIEISPKELENMNLDTTSLKNKSSIHKLIKRPELDIKKLSYAYPNLKEKLKAFNDDEIEQAEIQVKYDTYIKQEEYMAEKTRKLENTNIPQDFVYSKIKNLSTEAIEKLSKIRPHTLGQASRISGVSPTDISIIIVHMGK